MSWLSTQAAVACWFLLSTAVDRQFLFYFVLALSFPAGCVPYILCSVALLTAQEGFAIHEVPRAVWLGLNLAMWAGAVAAGYWPWFVFVPRQVRRRV